MPCVPLSLSRKGTSSAERPAPLAMRLDRLEALSWARTLPIAKLYPARLVPYRFNFTLTVRVITSNTCAIKSLLKRELQAIKAQLSVALNRKPERKRRTAIRHYSRQRQAGKRQLAAPLSSPSPPCCNGDD